MWLAGMTPEVKGDVVCPKLFAPLIERRMMTPQAYSIIYKNLPWKRRDLIETGSIKSPALRLKSSSILKYSLLKWSLSAVLSTEMELLPIVPTFLDKTVLSDAIVLRIVPV